MKSIVINPLNEFTIWLHNQLQWKQHLGKCHQHHFLIELRMALINHFITKQVANLYGFHADIRLAMANIIDLPAPVLPPEAPNNVTKGKCHMSPMDLYPFFRLNLGRKLDSYIQHSF